MIMYKQTKTIEGQVRNDQIQRTSDNAFIPFDEANTDYQAYLKFLADGNVPLAAETNTPTPADGE
jgi:hypothetical protein